MGFGRYRFRRSFGNVSSQFRGATPKHYPLFSGLLDQYGGAAAAYSLRALSAGWLAGDVVEVRRSSDSTTQDFTASEITNGDLETFCGAGDGFVSTWYDQSGNANNATQATTTSQPKIVSAGALVVGGIDFDGFNDGLSTTGQVLTTSAFFATSVVQHDTGVIGANGESVCGQYELSTSGRFHLSANASNEYSFFANATDSIVGLTTGAVGTSQTLISIDGDGSNAEIWRDGTSKATDTYSGFTPAMLDFTIGIDSSGQREFDGKIAEVIVYDSSQSANRVGIETNINDAYSIY